MFGNWINLPQIVSLCVTPSLFLFIFPSVFLFISLYFIFNLFYFVTCYIYTAEWLSPLPFTCFTISTVIASQCRLLYLYLWCGLHTTIWFMTCWRNWLCCLTCLLWIVCIIALYRPSNIPYSLLIQVFFFFKCCSPLVFKIKKTQGRDPTLISILGQAHKLYDSSHVYVNS